MVKELNSIFEVYSIIIKKLEYDLNHGWNRMLYHQHIMKKYKVLLLSLQLGFPVEIDTCNSWYLYNLECY